jgi:ATP-binding cassette subfamily B protein
LPVFALVFGLIAAGFMLFAWLSFKKVRILNEKDAAASSKLTAQLADTVTNMSAVKSFANEKQEIRLFQKRNLKYFNTSRMLMRAIITRDVGFGTILVTLAITTFEIGRAHV